MNTLKSTTAKAHDNHIAALESNPSIERLFKDESIHRDEFDFHTVAVLKDGTRYIVGYCDHPHYEIYELGTCPVKAGQGLFQSVSDALSV